MTDFKILDKNIKYSFSDPKLYRVNKGQKWEIHIYYTFEDKKLKIRDSKGLNDAKYFVTIESLLTQGKTKREANKIHSTLQEARAEEAKHTINQYKEWIAYREFNPTLKAFLLPNTEKPLLHYYQLYIEEKTLEKKSKGTIKQYESKTNLFKQFLIENNLEDIKVNDDSLYDIYDDYLRSIKQQGKRHTYHNDILNFHRIIFKFIIVQKRIKIDNPLISQKPLNKEYVTKHTAIPSQHINESFSQLRQYGSPILSLFAQVIFYTLHRPNTLVQLQFKEIDLENDIITIPPHKMKTKNKVLLKIQPALKEIIQSYINENEVNPNDYLFGFNIVKNARKRDKREYKLFGANQTEREVYTNMFAHFIEKQIVKAYKNNDSLTKIFEHKKNSLYGYKHTSVVFLRENNWSLSSVQAMSGHKDKEILEIYSRDFKAELPAFPTILK